MFKGKLSLLMFVLGGNIIFGATQSGPVSDQGLVHIDMTRVVHKISTIKKEQSAVWMRRALALGGAAVAVAWWWTRESSQDNQKQPNQVEKKTAEEVNALHYQLLERQVEKIDSISWRMRDAFCGSLVGALVALIFNKLSNIGDRISSPLPGYFSMNTPTTNELSQEIALRWRVLCDVLATYSSQTKDFAGALTKNKELSVFVTADVYTAYGSLMYTIERAMAYELVLVAQADKNGQGKQACMQNFKHVAESFNQSATVLEGILNDVTVQPDQKKVEAFMRVFNSACVEFVNAIDQAEGVIGGGR